MFLDYELPADLIAQRPVEPRDHARLLVVRRADASIEHCHVFDLPELLQPGDLVVVNDTRVLPARLLGRRAKTGGKWEGLYLGTTPNGDWRMLCQTRGTLSVGERIEIEPGPLTITLVDRQRGEPFTFHVESPGAVVDLLERHGHVPLPPYIRKGRDDDADRISYQTVFAHEAGSVAAPTAGLHFTNELLQRLGERGIEKVSVTLHVGLGTFQPLTEGDPEKHVMHREMCAISETTATLIETTKRAGGRVVAVGTTSARTLETAKPQAAWRGETDLYIRPGFQFQTIDALMTNFHLPRTTLLLLVGAFAGDDLIRRAYETALAERYRFFSYGDAMLVL